MHYKTAGQGNPPILFVHGFACDLSDWQAQCDRLQEDTTVLACDLRGHGSTPGQPADCSIETYGADVASLLAKLELPPAILVGHSMGCRVVLQAYRDAPERVAGLVLLDGSSIGTGDRGAAEQAMSEHLRVKGYEAFVRDFFEEMFVASSDPNLKSAIIARALRLPAEIGANLMPRLAGWDAAEARTTLDSVLVPLLAIQSTTLNSECKRVSLCPGQTSTWMELVRDHVPSARIVTLPGQGHFPHLEKSGEVNALIADFVRESPLAGSI